MLVLFNVIMEPSSLVPIHLLLATECSPTEAFYYSSQPRTDLFIGYVWIGLKNPASAAGVFFFFFVHAFVRLTATIHEQQPQNLTFLTLFSQSMHTVHCSRIHKFHFSVTFSLKMGSTILFTHLKIIFLQYFSVFSFSFQLYPNGPYNVPYKQFFLYTF